MCVCYHSQHYQGYEDRVVFGCDADDRANEVTNVIGIFSWVLLLLSIGLNNYLPAINCPFIYDSSNLIKHRYNSCSLGKKPHATYNFLIIRYCITRCFAYCCCVCRIISFTSQEISYGSYRIVFWLGCFRGST